MTPRKIKIVLLQKGITQTQLAKKIDVHRTSICQVVNHMNLHKQRQTRSKMAEYLGIPEDKLWSEKDITKSCKKKRVTSLPVS